MAGGDFFKRKGLLPTPKGSQQPQPRETQDPTVPGFVSPPDVSEDAFSRPTLVPETPPQDEAARWELRERATTARAPQPTPGSPTAQTDANDVESDDRITVTVGDVPPLGAPALLAQRGRETVVHPAIHPPANAGTSMTPESGPQLLGPAERTALATRETVPDMPESTSAQPDSGLSALGFVDAIPRATSIPPGRNSTASDTPVPQDRVSVASLSELYALSDFSGALELAERRLESNPNDVEAQRYVQDCRRVLVKMQLSRLGSLQQIVELAVDSNELQWLTIDHRAGFLLSLIDGLSTLEDLLDICGMPRLQALQIFADLADQKVVRLRPMVTF